MATEKFISNVRWEGEGLRVQAVSRDFPVYIDEPPQLGGKDTAMTPMEMLLASLGSCVAITALSLAPKLQITIDDLSVEVVGQMDTDGFKGIDPSVRKGFEQITVQLHIVSKASDELKEKLAALVERTCPVTDTLKHGVKVEAVLQD
ncbi:MAG: OsmC family protein [Spirochaetia bacterium]|nr:OsmC family protein [Spirochaetia bacterium]